MDLWNIYFINQRKICYFMDTEFILLLLFQSLVVIMGIRSFVWSCVDNALLLILIGLYFVTAYMLEINLNTIIWHAAAGLIVFILGFALFFISRSIISAGVLKAAAVFAIWFGWTTDFLIFLIASFLLNGLFAIIVLSPLYRVLKFLPSFKNGRIIPYATGFCLVAFYWSLSDSFLPIVSRA